MLKCHLSKSSEVLKKIVGWRLTVNFFSQNVLNFSIQRSLLENTVSMLFRWNGFIFLWITLKSISVETIGHYWNSIHYGHYTASADYREKKNSFAMILELRHAISILYVTLLLYIYIYIYIYASVWIGRGASLTRPWSMGYLAVPAHLFVLSNFEEKNPNLTSYHGTPYITFPYYTIYYYAQYKLVIDISLTVV